MTAAKPIRLGIVVDSAAALRQIRLTSDPDPVAYGLAAIEAGADCVLATFRSDRRLTADRDLELLCNLARGKVYGIAAPRPALIATLIAAGVTGIVLNPETRGDYATGGGLEIRAVEAELLDAIAACESAGVSYAVNIDPEISIIEHCAALGIHNIEINCDAYGLASSVAAQNKKLAELKLVCERAKEFDMSLAVRRGIDHSNLSGLLELSSVSEVRIGHAIAACALFEGIPQSVQRFIRLTRGISR